MGLKVLVVDDRYSMRSLIKKTLHDKGHTVIGEAKNGKEGIQLYQELKPDLVTMDIDMPEMSGIDAIKEIKKIDPEATIIVVSKDVEAPLKEKIFSLGVKEFVKKPFQPGFLQSRVDQIFEEEKEKNKPTEKPISTITEQLPSEDPPVIEEDQEIIDDFFNEEIEILNEPIDKGEPIIITNDNEQFDFPNKFKEEEEKYALKENFSEPFQESFSSNQEDNSPSFEIPKTAIDEKPQHLNEDKNITAMDSSNKENPNLSKTNSEKENQKGEPIFIRPPRINILQDDTYNIDDVSVYDDIESIVLNVDEEESVQSNKPKGLINFLKGLFKK